MSSPIGSFLAALHEIIPAHRTADWDVSGLQLGDPSGAARTVAVAHEVTEAVVASVQAQQVDLLITYHPLLFRPTNRLIDGPTAPGRALRLIRTGTAVAVAHTSFDAAEGGTADALAEALGCTNITGFGPVAPAGAVKVVTFVPESAADGLANAMAAAGAGAIGNYSGCSFRTPGLGVFQAGPGAAPAAGEPGGSNREPEIRLEMLCPSSRLDGVVAALVADHPYEEPAFDVIDTRSNMGLTGRVGNLPAPVTVDEFAEAVRVRLGSSGLRVSVAGSLVERVAVVAGSGSSFLGAARATGADVFVTGDVGHHAVREVVDGGLAVIDPGHAGTERPGMSRLAAVVAGVCARFGSEMVDLTAFDPTPWR
ncbi:MAG: Nif3-like dinuclear metal center hexameric protein [Acidimicrobiia bacterium]